jgi:hypothetical protein
MTPRSRGARCRRAWALAVIVAATPMTACDGSDVSVGVGVGVAVPAPWGGVRVSAAVPLGPYYGGRYGPMW